MSTWGQPGVNLGSTWGQPGVNLGSTWGQSALPYHVPRDQHVHVERAGEGAQQAVSHLAARRLRRKHAPPRCHGPVQYERTIR